MFFIFGILVCMVIIYLFIFFFRSFDGKRGHFQRPFVVVVERRVIVIVRLRRNDLDAGHRAPRFDRTSLDNLEPIVQTNLRRVIRRHQRTSSQGPWSSIHTSRDLIIIHKTRPYKLNSTTSFLHQYTVAGLRKYTIIHHFSAS